MNNIALHQIFYDEKSKSELDPLLLPLDNTHSKDSSWFEFLPILNYLENHTLSDDVWYGFLSPKFSQKSGFPVAFVLDLLEKYRNLADVMLFSPGWDQLAYFLNPFEQGDYWHPGLLSTSQNFLNKFNIDIDLLSMVTHSTTSVFSNYIVAKPVYWREWIKIAKNLYAYVQDGNDASLVTLTDYGCTKNVIQMKAFVQERLSSIVLYQNKFRVISPDQSQNTPVYLFAQDPRTRKMLQACDLLKERYITFGDLDSLKMYQKIRNEIQFRVIS